MKRSLLFISIKNVTFALLLLQGEYIVMLKFGLHGEMEYYGADMNQGSGKSTRNDDNVEDEMVKMIIIMIIIAI